MKLSTCRCGGLKHDGKCDRCRNKSASRKTTKQRGYGNDWRKLSERVRANEPQCLKCKQVYDRDRPAEEVHHIDSIDAAPWRRLDATNLMPLCKECHNDEHNKPSGRE